MSTDVDYLLYYRYFLCIFKIFENVNVYSRADYDHIHCTALTGDFPPVEGCFDEGSLGLTTGGFLSLWVGGQQHPTTVLD